MTLFDTLFEFSDEIVTYRFLCYLLLLFIVMLVERKISSAGITIAVLVLGEGVHLVFIEPLYEIAKHQQIINKFGWYGSWIIIDTFILFILYEAHSKMKLRVTTMAQFYGATLIFFNCCQAIDFIDRASINTNAFSLFYQYGIFSVNMIMLPAMILLWLRQRRLQRTVYGT